MQSDTIEKIQQTLMVMVEERASLQDRIEKLDNNIHRIQIALEVWKEFGISPQGGNDSAPAPSKGATLQAVIMVLLDHRYPQSVKRAEIIEHVTEHADPEFDTRAVSNALWLLKRKGLVEKVDGQTGYWRTVRPRENMEASGDTQENGHTEPSPREGQRGYTFGRRLRTLDLDLPEREGLLREIERPNWIEGDEQE